MKRLVLALLVGLVVAIDVAPVLAQAEERIVVAQEQRRRTLFDLLFGEEPPAPVQARPPAVRAPAALPPPAVVIEKAPGATRLAVFGDSLAVDLGKALERYYAEDPNLVVIGHGVGSSGFVRTDYFDWTGAVNEQIAADSFDLAVVMIGINDRQEITTGERTLEPFSDEWNAAYQARLSRFLNALRSARKPVIWVGLPPMSKTDFSTSMSQISALQKLAAFSGGAEFLDIYERFLGEDGRFSASGPDVNGQNARMRKDDGIHFAAAGAEKIAFYLSQPIRTFYRGGAMTVAVSDPLLGTEAGAMLRPPYQGLGQVRLLELAGAVIPISRTPLRAGQLISAAPPGAPEPLFSLEQVVRAPVGRADAFGVGVSLSDELDEGAGP